MRFEINYPIFNDEGKYRQENWLPEKSPKKSESCEKSTRDGLKDWRLIWVNIVWNALMLGGKTTQIVLITQCNGY